MSKSRDKKKQKRQSKERLRREQSLRGTKKDAHKRRAERIKAQSDGTVTKRVLRRLYNRKTCCYCKKFTPKDQRTIDHVIPIAQGGKHAADNLRMACLKCNSRKGSMNLQDFLDSAN